MNQNGNRQREEQKAQHSDDEQRAISLFLCCAGAAAQSVTLFVRSRARPAELGRWLDTRDTYT